MKSSILSEPIYFIHLNVRHPIEYKKCMHSKWDLVGYSGGSLGLENAVKSEKVGPADRADLFFCLL